MTRIPVLVVNSDQFWCEDISRYFRISPTFQVVDMALNGSDAITKAQQLMPAITIVNSNLPDYQGSVVIPYLLRINPQMKIVAVMDANHPEIYGQLAQAGSTQILIQPSVQQIGDCLDQLAKKYGLVKHGQVNIPNQPNPATNQTQNTTPTGSWQQGINPVQTGGLGTPSDGMNQYGQGAGVGISGDNQWSNPLGGVGQNNPTAFNPLGSIPQSSPAGTAPFGDTPSSNPLGSTPPINNPLGSPMPSNNPLGAGAGTPPMGQGGFSIPSGQPKPTAPPKPAIDLGIPQTPKQSKNIHIKQKVFSIGSPKGGVGKTSFAVELANAFAQTKINGEPLKTVLVDADFDFGDVAILMKLDAWPNITKWTKDIQQRLQKPGVSPRDITYTQQEIDNFLLTYQPTGLKVLAAPTNPAEALYIDADIMGIIIDNLKACDFDVIIIDTGNNTRDYTLISYQRSNLTLVMATPEVATINDINNFMNALRDIKFGTDRMQLVVNKVVKGVQSISISDIAETLGMNVIDVLPDIPRQIIHANNTGERLVLGRDNEFTIAVKKIGNKIMGAPILMRKKEIRRGGKGGFMSKLGKK